MTLAPLRRRVLRLTTLSPTAPSRSSPQTPPFSTRSTAIRPTVAQTRPSYAPPVPRPPRRAFTMTDAKDEPEDKVRSLETKQAFEEAKAEKGLMVLDCYATWCGPCKAIAPQVRTFSAQYPTARFYKLDVDNLPDLAHELGVRAMPTFLFFKDGEMITKVVGANTKALGTAIEQYSDKVEKKTEGDEGEDEAAENKA